MTQQDEYRPAVVYLGTTENGTQFKCAEVREVGPSDDDIAKAIGRESGIIILLSLLGRKDKAQLFANHVLRLVCTHKDALGRWIATRRVAHPIAEDN